MTPTLKALRSDNRTATKCYNLHRRGRLVDPDDCTEQERVIIEMVREYADAWAAMSVSRRRKILGDLDARIEDARWHHLHRRLSLSSFD